MAASLEAERKQELFRAICVKLSNNDSSATALDLSAYGEIDCDEAEILCDALHGNTRLCDLTMGTDENFTSAKGLLLLVPFLATVPNLETFKLTDNGATSSWYQAAIGTILNTLACSGSLSKISLNRIRYDRPQVLEKILSKTRTLKELEFSNRGDSGNFSMVCESLRHGFRKNKTLETIAFTSAGGPHVETALFGLFDLPKLKSLKLNVVLTREVSQVLGCFFKCNETLQSLTLKLRPDGESLLAPVLMGLAYNRGIQDVEMTVSGEQASGAAPAWTELFQENTSMKSFTLRKDHGCMAIGRACATAIAGGLCGNFSLQKLDLWGALGADAFDGAAWQTMIQTNNSLTELGLVCCNLGKGGKGQVSFKLFTVGLSHNTSLKKLSLNSNYIGNEGGDALADALVSNETIEHLRLTDNDMEDADGQAVIHKLWSNKGLQRLDCTTNSVGGLGRAFAEGLPKNQTLKEVDFSCCDIDSEECRTILDSLHGNKVLVELNMTGSQATLDGSCVTALTELLASTPLRKLDLQGSHISSDGMTQLTDCLRGNTSLRRLNLGECELGNEGLLQLAEALVENATLAELFLDGNDFDQGSCCGFMQLLPQMKGLKELTIDSSFVSEASGSELVKGLQGNKSLETIHGIGDSELPSDMKKSINLYLKMNRNGRKFLQESQDDQAVPLPFGVWPRILAKMTSPSERDQLFHFLRKKGDIVQCPPPSRKRKASREPATDSSSE